MEPKGSQGEEEAKGAKRGAQESKWRKGSSRVHRAWKGSSKRIHGRGRRAKKGYDRASGLNGVKRAGGTTGANKDQAGRKRHKGEPAENRRRRRT